MLELGTTSLIITGTIAGIAIVALIIAVILLIIFLA